MSFSMPHDLDEKQLCLVLVFNQNFLKLAESVLIFGMFP